MILDGIWRYGAHFKVLVNFCVLSKSLLNGRMNFWSCCSISLPIHVPINSCMHLKSWNSEIRFMSTCFMGLGIHGYFKLKTHQKWNQKSWLSRQILIFDLPPKIIDFFHCVLYVVERERSSMNNCLCSLWQKGSGFPRFTVSIAIF